MKTETKTTAEYKAPKCKVVSLHINRAFMLENGSYESNINDWEYDGETL